MGQNKMEKDFRNKLNQREIAPSANAWDRLDAMLTVAEEKKPKRDFGWLYIAASILGFLFVGTIYFSQTQEMTDVKRNDVVLQEKQPESDAATQNPKIIVPEPTASENIAAVTEKTGTPSNRSETKSSSKNQISNLTHIINEVKQNELIAVTTTPESTKASVDKTIINQKAEQTNNAKVDELLASVHPVQKSETAKTSVKVNAKSLLSQVDGELNLSFREKMLRKIGRNYQEVAEAVSIRNIQQ